MISVRTEQIFLKIDFEHEKSMHQEKKIRIKWEVLKWFYTF